MAEWILLAFLSAIFATLTSILAKIGIKDIDSNLATAIRTCVVLVMAWIVVAMVGSFGTVSDISMRTLLFLVLSGLATGGSWLCYFKAIQAGNVNKVAPIDKSSTVLTMVLAFILLGESFSVLSGIGLVLIFIGTMLMIEKKDVEESEGTGRTWLIFAILSAVFASLTAILGKIGIEGVESNLGTAIRTTVVLVMAWLVVAIRKPAPDKRKVSRTNGIFLVLSGLATGASWLCFYAALQNGPASVIVPIDKLSILFTIIFATFVLGEKTTGKAWGGLALLVAGTLTLLL